MSGEFVVFAPLELGKQEIDVLLNLGEFRHERPRCINREITRYAARCKSRCYPGGYDDLESVSGLAILDARRLLMTS